MTIASCGSWLEGWERSRLKPIIGYDDQMHTLMTGNTPSRCDPGCDNKIHSRMSRRIMTGYDELLSIFARSMSPGSG